VDAGACFFLSMGLTLGMLWATKSWAGAALAGSVENAGFLPWLTATAFLHSIMSPGARGDDEGLERHAHHLTFF